MKETTKGIRGTLAEERKRTESTFRFFLAAVISLFTRWSGNALLSFYTGKILATVGITNPHTVQMIIFGWTCWGLVAGTSVATLISPSSKVEIGSPKAVIPVLVFMFLYTPFYVLGWGSLTYTYLSELFPYYQRSQGIAVEQFTVRIASFIGSYVNPIALFNIGWKYYIVYYVWIAIEALTVYFFFPETKDRTLEELAFMERMDEVMGYQPHELGPIPEEEENREPVVNERVVNTVTP
ncbi:uncharacterized protein B0T23DRAFT_416315 [Neurospora hispaniola]|uniref:Major facilitator superfamily (MFS) profile domain-containing protein n=1 Tax=Neurospora hispaniola TaxID=588809 RepID=A0AAJ0HYB9_9PEZI|nr:hypothetical protein B0T23DRAFT_416315 [Neurospora hispaniola]